jgi:hypothetical protein
MFAIGNFSRLIVAWTYRNRATSYIDDDIRYSSQSLLTRAAITSLLPNWASGEML